MLLNPTATVTDPDGTRYWFRHGMLHRDDGPAFESANGDKFWYRDDKQHRDDGPAVEYANGNKAWYRDGKQHREDGPAVEFNDGSAQWWRHGKFLFATPEVPSTGQPARPPPKKGFSL